jgi:hypothetical protein
MAFIWASKDPDEVLDYNHDWSARLEGDTVAGAPQVIVEEGTITVESTTMGAGDVQTVWLSGGTSGQDVRLTLRIETAGGRTYDEGIKLKIKER